MLRKILIISIIFWFTSGVNAFAQVTEQAIVPVIIDVSQILRMNIASGGNIEFVFNSINDYRVGVTGVGSSMYTTQFNIASSTPWSLNFGTENINLSGTDNPLNNLPASIIGFELQSIGTYTLGNEIISVPTANGADIAALDLFPVSLMQPGAGPLPRNAGGIADNSFLIIWRCGTAEGPSMFPETLLEMQPSPPSDRYVANVYFELIATP